ncbi:GRIP and coiled-coil domain-containing protein 2-like isoform X6 [Bolinopsis microptera]|uniref:GRIP and coiled-coil domain-containing protein 2-like isoform X6 n=1 Tax=Bolinopsis microptera TaxID=2820187 RepID=UPI003079E69E
MISPDQLRGLNEAEYVEIIRYIIAEYDEQNASFNKLSSDHQNLHSLYEDQMSAIKETLSQKLNAPHNISSSSVGAFEVVEEAVRELSLQHEEEIKSLMKAKDDEIESITSSLVSHDNRYFMEQIKELQSCITELTVYMTRDTQFIPPASTSELCSAAKQFIVSNHAVSMAEMESKHMLEINQLKVELEEKMRDLEMSHAYSRGDLEAKYDQILLDKEDGYHEKMRCLDEQVYCLESELTMLKGDMSKAELSAEREGIESELKSSSNEFFVHVTEHASPPPTFTDSNRYREEKQEVLTTPKKNIPKRTGIRPPKQRAVKNKQAAEKENQNEMKPTKLNPVKEKLVNQEKEGKTLKVKSVCAWSQTLGVPMLSSTSQTVIRNSTDNCSQTDDITEGNKKIKKSSTQDDETKREDSKFKNQVDQIEDLWNDLIPTDDSLNLADCSFAAMDFSIPTDCITQEPVENTEIRHLGLEDTEILPEEYITSRENSENYLDNISQGSDEEEGLQNSNDLFGVSGDDMMRSRDTTGSLNEDSPHKMMGRILAQRVTDEVLRGEMEEEGEMSTFQEMQILLANKEQEIEAQDFQIFELREALERSREDSKRLNMLNMIHMDTAICRDVSQPTVADIACSPIPPHLETRGTRDHGNQEIPSRDLVEVGVNTSFVFEDDISQHPHKSNITSLLAQLNLEDTRTGNKTLGDETLNTTTGAPDLSLFDLTLTTGLSHSENPEQATLINHLCDIQSEAMKIQDRSDELCRDNERLHNQVGELSKELEVERGKVKNKIREIMEEREKNKKLETQILANKELHKKKLDEVFAFHQRELDELTAKKELTEEQAKGLAKLINVEPDKELVSTDCQTSLVFSNFVLHMSTETKGTCPDNTPPNNDTDSLKQQLIQVEEEYLALKDQTRSIEGRSNKLEDHNRQLVQQARLLEEQARETEQIYLRQNQEKNALIEMTNREKKEVEEELVKMKEVVSVSEEIISSVVPNYLMNNSDLPTMQLRDSPMNGDHFAVDSSQMSNDTVNFSCLTNAGEECALPGATRYLAGFYKTATEQVQELEQLLHQKDFKLNSLVSTNSGLSNRLSQSEANLKSLKGKMSDYDDIKEKLQEANRAIAKLKGEILKLSTEAQNAQFQGNSADDELIEENEDLKCQVEKLEEIKATLLNDVQLLREQLDEDQVMNDQAAKEIAEANELIEQLKSHNDNLEETLQTSEDRNRTLEDNIRSLEEQLATLQTQIKQEKTANRELLEKAEDATSSKNSKHNKEMADLRTTRDELQSTIDQLKGELRRKGLEIEEVNDNNSSLQRKLNKLQPSLDSYEEENLKLKDQLSSQQAQMLKLKREVEELLSDKEGLGESLSALRLKVNVERKHVGTQSKSVIDPFVNAIKSNVSSTLKLKLKEAKDKISQHEVEAENQEKALKKVTIELHECKEQLASAEEKIEKLESALDDLKGKVNVRKKSASSQAAVSRYDVGSTCTLLDSNMDPDLQQNYDKLKSQLGEMSSELESLKKTRIELEAQVTQIQTQKSNSDNLSEQLQQEHAAALERLRATLNLEKEEALNVLTREAETARQKRDDSYRQDLERRELESKRQLEKVIGDMEKKREQDCAMIARKVGLDPNSLATTAPDSSQLTDRIEALHNQALQIRNLALSFYEASHPPTREASVQAIVKMFKCSTQTPDVDITPPPKSSESLHDFIKVFKEEHEKQTEVLLKQLRTDEKPVSPCEDVPQLKEEIKRLRLSLETYTTRCAMLEHNSRILKDRNTGLENDMIASAAQHNSFLMADEDSQLYNSHAQRPEPRDLRKRLAACQSEIGKLQDNVSEYQEAIEHLETELDREIEERKRAEKRMRSAESAVIEIKNDDIMARDSKDDTLNTDLNQAKESCRLLETENKKLKTANGKLRNLNNTLMESNKQLKHADNENYVLNVSSKSSNLIHEIDNLKEVEDLRMELTSKETDLARKENRISLLESEIDTKSSMIKAQKDEMESKDKVIRMIKSELSAQQLDIAELKAMLEIERTRGEELERRLKSSDLRQLDDSSARDELKRLRSENSELLKEYGPGSPNSRSRVTKAYLKFLRAESYRKALVFQKQYLLNLLSKAKAVENAALSILEIKQDDSKKTKPRFKHAVFLVIASIRMRNLVVKWRKVRESLEEKQRRKQTPSTCHSSQLTEHRALTSQNDIRPPVFDKSPSPVPKISSTTSLHSGYPKWDSSRPLSPPSHPRDGLSNRVYGSPSPDPSLSRLDQQLARLRQTINTRAAYNEQKNDRSRVSDHASPLARVSDHASPSARVSDHATPLSRGRNERVTPERDSGVCKPVQGEDDSSGTLSDISNYISRLEAVQSRLTDLKLSSYKIYDTNKSLT